jgi:hypothetical protein
MFCLEIKNFHPKVLGGIMPDEVAFLRSELKRKLGTQAYWMEPEQGAIPLFIVTLPPVTFALVT